MKHEKVPLSHFLTLNHGDKRILRIRAGQYYKLGQLFYYKLGRIGITDYLQIIQNSVILQDLCPVMGLLQIRAG